MDKFFRFNKLFKITLLLIIALLGAGLTFFNVVEASNESYNTTQQEESYAHFKTSYEKISADSDNSLTVQSERHLYKPGDEVKMEGTIWSNLISAVGGINTVLVQITDNEGTVIYSGDNQVNNDGDYAINFTLPSDAKQGSYTISVKADVNSNVLSTLTLKTQASLESATKFVVVSPKAWAIKAEDKDFDVIIATNSTAGDVKFDEQAKKVSFMVQGETGTKGVAEVTIPKSMLSGNLTVMMDSQIMSQDDVIVTSDTQDEITLEINYHHSSHEIDIVGTNAVSEFPISIIALTLATAFVILASLRTKFFRKI